MKAKAQLWQNLKINFCRLFFACRCFILLTTIVTLVVVFLRQSSGLQSIELAAFDRLMRWRGDLTTDSRLLVVAISESDIQTWQQSTLSDRLVARLIHRLQEYRPRVIGLDIYRDIPQLPGKNELRQELEAENIIAIEYLDTNAPVPPPPGIPQQRIGFNDVLLDLDGVVRRNLLYGEIAGQKLYSFALRNTMKYLASNNLKLKVNSKSIQIGDTVFSALQSNSGSYEMPSSDAFGWQIMLNYRSLNNVARQVTLTQVLNGNVDPDWIKDKIVLIGYTAPSKKDLFVTPYGVTKMPGVILQTQMTSQILSTILDRQPVFWFWSQWQEFLWIWFWAGLGYEFFSYFKHPSTLVVALCVALSVLLIICRLTFLHAGWIPLIAPGIAFIITAKAILVLRIFYSSFYDELTGLPNRLQTIKELNRIAQQQLPGLLVIMSIDLDRFKTIDASLGHHFRDRLLIEIGQRLQNCLKSQARLGKLNGNEFVVILAPIKTRSRAVAMVKSWQAKLNRPFELDTQKIVIDTSFGISFFPTPSTNEPKELLRNAYNAMYRAKNSGKNRCEIFTQPIDLAAIERLKLENDLRQAIKLQEFELYYQPIINLKTDRIWGFEALVRWQSPTRGLVTPDEFIPLAEETGAIVPLGLWILQTACHQMHSWHRQFPDEPLLTISVNLSGHQFASVDLVEQIDRIVQTSGLKYEYLKLEITESAAIANFEVALEIFRQLKNLGIKLSLDDFGTGYSSLSYLQSFAADTLKIDRSFVKQMQLSDKNREIIQTIIVLTQKLEMQAIAEGIETRQQLNTLKSWQCDYGQGYLFSKPLSNRAATQFIALCSRF